MKKLHRKPAALTPSAPRRGREKSPQATSKLEEVLNFSNLTDFRNSLLNVIPKLQENEYLRFVITKHGEPAAVIMSYQAYLLLKRAAERIVKQEAAEDSEASLRDAYEEMTGEPLSAEQPEPLAFAVETTRDIRGPEIQKVKDVVRLAVQEYIRATSSKQST
jgi:prevent-host-death family protein